MKTVSGIRLAMVGLWLVGGLAWGGVTNAPVTRLGEIVVTTSREVRNPVATPTIESVSLDIVTSIVDAEDIRLQNTATLDEAMDYSTGVFTERRGRKEKTFTSFRGQIYPYPDVAINGVWQRAFTSIPPFFPAAAIDRIEILRSGGAIMVGPNAGLVGAINIVPRRFDEPTTLLDVQGGSYGTYRASLLHGNRLDRADYTIGASYYTTEGPRDENAAEQVSSLFGTFGWDVGDDLRLEFTGYGLTGERELRIMQNPGQKSLQGRLDEEFDPFSSYGGILRALWKHDERSSTEIDAGYVRRDMDYRFTPKDPTKKPVHKDEIDWEYNAGVMHARRIGDANTLRAGVQYNHWVCPDGKRYFVGKRMDVETWSGVIVDEHQWDRLTVDGGLRVTRSYYRDYTDNTIDTLGGPPRRRFGSVREPGSRNAHDRRRRRQLAECGPGQLESGRVRDASQGRYSAHRYGSHAGGGYVQCLRQPGLAAVRVGTGVPVGAHHGYLHAFRQRHADGFRTVRGWRLEQRPGDS